MENIYDDPLMWNNRYQEFMGRVMESGVATGYFDMGGNVDLYVGTKTKSGRLYRNNGDGTFSDTSRQMA